MEIQFAPAVTGHWCLIRVENGTWVCFVSSLGTVRYTFAPRYVGYGFRKFEAPPRVESVLVGAT